MQSNLNDAATSSDVQRHGFDEAASTAFLIHVFDENDVQVKLPSIPQSKTMHRTAEGADFKLSWFAFASSW